MEAIISKNSFKTWWLYLYYIKVQSINLFKQSQVFRYTLYIFTWYTKMSLSSLQFTFKLTALVLLALSSYKRKMFLEVRQNNRNLCCISKNLKDKVIHPFKVMRILWSLYTTLICAAPPMNSFWNWHFDIFTTISS